MAALSSKLRSLAAPTKTGIGFWCPGCDAFYAVYTFGTGGPIWQWDGNVDEPTISPSILVYDTPVAPRCHSFVRRGQIEFLADSTHALAGKTVPLPDFPTDFDA